MAVLGLLALPWRDSSGCASPPSNLQGWFLPPAPRGRAQAAGLSTPSHPEPVTTLTMANCSIGFYKLSSKYLGMPNISAAAGISVCKLFMNQCLNSQGTLLSINYFSPSSCGLGAALFYFRTTACNLSLVSRLRGHHSDPGRQSGVNQGIGTQSYIQVSGHGSALWGHGTGFWGTQSVSCLQPLSSQADARNQGL